MNIPALRFPEFSGPWKALPFGEIAALRTDIFRPRTSLPGSPSNRASGNGTAAAPFSSAGDGTDARDAADTAAPLPCVELEHLESGTGTITGFTHPLPSMTAKNRFYRGDVLFGKLRPNLRKFARPDFDGICSQEIWALNGILADNGFLFQLVQTPRFQQAALATSGTRMPRADWKTVSAVPIPIPSLEEQRAIAAFLTSIDQETAVQRQVLDSLRKRKDGVLETLLEPGDQLLREDASFKETETQPVFPDTVSPLKPAVFCGNQQTEPSGSGWRLIPLSAILTERREYARKGEQFPHFSLTKEGVIPKTARYDRDFLVKTPDKPYKITRAGDICYNPANLKFGVISRNRLGDGIFSPIYVTFTVNRDFSPGFVECALTRPAFLRRALRYQEGTVYERMAVKPEHFLSISIPVPDPKTQREIAGLAGLLRQQIEAETQVLDDLNARKQGLLEMMFP